MSNLKLPNFFSARGYLNDIPNYRFSTADLSTARSALNEDIDCFFTNGLISLASSIHSIGKSNYSWGFIQSYYSLFFFARAFIGISGHAIVYENSKPYSIKIQPGETFGRLKGNSHDVVFTHYKNAFSSDILLTNTIESLNPVDWFNSKRNLINYTLNPFTDPVPPVGLYNYKSSLRKWLSTYIEDTGHSYTFDQNHCFLAYPLQVFLRLYSHFDSNGIKLQMIDSDKFLHLQKNFADEKGSLTAIVSRISDIIEL